MDICLENMGFVSLSTMEEYSIDGGFELVSFFSGLAIFGATLIAIACAPATAFVGAAYAAMTAGTVFASASSGALMGYGLAK